MKTIAWLVAAITVVGATLPQLASATTVWRCGAEGRTYSDSACNGGQALDVSDARTAEQVAQGREVLAADLRRAETMRRERLQREEAERRALAAVAGLKPAALRQPDRGQPRKAKEASKSEQELQAKRPKTVRPKPPANAADAADGTWRAVAPASPRTPG